MPRFRKRRKCNDGWQNISCSCDDTCTSLIFIKMKNCGSHKCVFLCVLCSGTFYIIQYQADIAISFSVC